MTAPPMRTARRCWSENGWKGWGSCRKCYDASTPISAMAGSRSWKTSRAMSNASSQAASSVGPDGTVASVPATSFYADPVGETRWVHEVAAACGLPSAMVCHAALHQDDAADILAQQAAFPLVRGIRHKPVTAASRAEVRRRAFRAAEEKCRICPAELTGTAGVVGAAAGLWGPHRGVRGFGGSGDRGSVR